MIITIDGPSASGKSSLARSLAKRLFYYYLYSGLLYRGCAYVLMKYGNYSKHTIRGATPHDVSELCNSKRILYSYNYTDGERLFFDGADITRHLKTPLIDDCSSLISTVPAIREEVRIIQHMLAAQQENLIADGRDMGTIAFPHADVKFFLTASVEVRAERWRLDQEKRGNAVTHAQAVEQLSERDRRDTIRYYSPLAVAPDAIMIDNSALSAEQTCALCERYLERHAFTIIKLR